jgi:hypothetical protein
MKRVSFLAIIAAVTLASVSAHAMTYFLVSQWWENGNQMCKYGNGTVLNMGVKVCPQSIQG